MGPELSKMAVIADSLLLVGESVADKVGRGRGRGLEHQTSSDGAFRQIGISMV